nr:hypothetical protein [Lachnospiraceae bacterium]
MSMNERKKLLFIIGGLLLLVSILIGMLIFLFVRNPEDEQEDGPWSAQRLRAGLETAVEYDKQYDSYIASEEQARQVIREYGVLQREKYSNPEVEKIELFMEEEFDICAVNLGEMDVATAEDIKRAFTYMYNEYPQLQGTLTNISVGNFRGEAVTYTALTQSRVFVIHETDDAYPFVVKHEIILNAAKFFDRAKFLRECEKQVADGYWPVNSDISSVIVHELGHQLLGVTAMEQFGLVPSHYITEENAEAYSCYMTDSLASNQTVAKSVEETAYAIWKERYGHTGSREQFRESISLYAKGLQPDGGVSYGETFAEAVADVYLNGENAADASRALIESLNKK